MFTLNICSCGLSFIFSVIVIYLIFKTSLFTTYSFKILIYISINDLLRSLIGIFETFFISNTEGCLIYGFFDNYFFLSNMILALCLTYTIYQIIVLEDYSFERHHKFWVFGSIFVPGVLEALPYTTQSYGNEGGLCLIDVDEIGTYWRFAVVYIPMMIMLILICIITFKISKKAKMLGTISFKSITYERGLIYTIIISMVLAPFFIIRIIQIFVKSCNINSFILLMNNFYNLQGFLNSIVFFNNKTVKELLRNQRNHSTSLQSKSSLCVSFASVIN